jgi:hypothetical protein
MRPGSAPWTTCRGCGVVLPGSENEPSPRPNASAACWRLYGEVIGYELAHVAELGLFHQLMVDTYAAQHAGGRASALNVAFAVIGLYLALEMGWSGDRVRDAHRFLANRFRTWPSLEPPPDGAGLTVIDVAMAGSAQEHGERIEAWALSVWRRWQPLHGAVAELISERLPSHPG